MMPEDVLIDMLPLSPAWWYLVRRVWTMVSEVDLGWVRVRAEDKLKQVITKRPAGLAL